MITFDIGKSIVCTTGALVAALVFTAAAAGPAQAETVRHRTASTADLGRSAPTAQTALDRRVTLAACDGSRQLRERAVNRRGAVRVIEGALSQARA